MTDDKPSQADPKPDDKPSQADPKPDDKAERSADSPMASPQFTGAVSAEPRVSTTAMAEKPLTGAERAQIVRQTADGIGTVKPQVTAAGQGQMTLHLHPKEWGDLRVTVQLAPPTASADGVKQTTVVAHVVASSPVVKAALEKHSGDLNQALHENGLHLERLTVAVQAAGAGEQSGGATGDSRNFGRQNQEAWQGAPSQTAQGNGGMGAGSSSSFASYSQRQGGSASPSQAVSRSAYSADDESDTVKSVSSGPTRLSAGFDQRV